MKLRDAIKFSLELLLPEKAVLAVEHFALERRPRATIPTSNEPAAAVDEAEHRTGARQMIEDLDSNQFGGPSFGPRTIALMSSALEEALAMLPQPVEQNYARTIAAAILEVAAGGERDPVRLRISAMSGLPLEATHIVEAAPATPSDRK